MTKPTEEQVRRVARSLASNLSHSDPDHVNKYAAKPRPEWMFFEGAAKAAIAAYDSELAKENVELKAEILEQCRIIGKSSEREAALLAKLERFEKALERIADNECYCTKPAECCCCLVNIACAALDEKAGE